MMPLRLFISLLALFLAGSTCRAESIVYIESALITGTLGTQSFTNAQFTLVGLGDTGGVTQQTGAKNEIVWSNNVVLSGSIQGVGAFTFPLATATVFSNPGVGLGFSLRQPPYAAADILDTFEDSVLAYNLGSALSPFATSSTNGLGFGAAAPTSSGELDFYPTKNQIFQAILPTPEPSSLVLLGIGLLAGIDLLRRKMIGPSSLTL